MQISATDVRVRYAEVDRLGAVNSARYFEWFELGRSDLLRGLGVAYGDIEARGLGLPVIDARCRYMARLGYDEMVRIETTVRLVSRSRLRFDFRVSRLEGAAATPAAEGSTEHAVIGPDGKPARLPEDIWAILEAQSAL